MCNYILATMAKLRQLLLGEVLGFRVFITWGPAWPWAYNRQGKSNSFTLQVQRRAAHFVSARLKYGQRTPLFSCQALAMLPKHIGKDAIESVVNQKSPNCNICKQ